jgi:hypothetical protein
MAFEIDTSRKITRALFDRLYDESLSYISVERQRLGSEVKERLWATTQRKDVVHRRYILDDYVVGCAVTKSIETDFSGQVEKWVWYLQPTYGETAVGSRSWWYSEDFQKVGRQYMDDNGYAKVVAIHNPTSPAAIAVTNVWGKNWDGRQYFNTPEVHPVSDVLESEQISGLSPTMRAFVISKNT